LPKQRSRKPKISLGINPKEQNGTRAHTISGGAQPLATWHLLSALYCIGNILQPNVMGRKVVDPKIRQSEKRQIREKARTKSGILHSGVISANATFGN